MGYQDDQYLFDRAVDLARALHTAGCVPGTRWPIGYAVMNAAYGILPLTSQKSRIRRMRAKRGRLWRSLPGEMTVCTGGIDMLGSAARGELSAHVQASGIGPQAMQKRAAKAHMLVDRVTAFSRESGCPNRVHMAWTLLAKAATAALTYDARLVPRDTLGITSREFERQICEAVTELLGGELDEHAVKRLALGGCGLRMDAVGLAAGRGLLEHTGNDDEGCPGDRHWARCRLQTSRQLRRLEHAWRKLGLKSTWTAGKPSAKHRGTCTLRARGTNTCQ